MLKGHDQSMQLKDSMEWRNKVNNEESISFFGIKLLKEIGNRVRKRWD